MEKDNIQNFADEFDKLQKFAKKANELFKQKRELGVIGYDVSENEIHLRSDKFIELFKNCVYETIERDYGEYLYELQKTVDGVKYYCIISERGLI